ncbi:Glyoxalase/Bleomycin resistance protein/Dihydroxybiphenyl dioxygenase [Ascodesmis nigricans]|uniref:Glyoxalase/Bleomycin resistance protein/Dihydroxybiphenyl dioxygenase n=1 Tax=Ascodesmis nigricans TaxID=341454 RepID=A0A4S2N7R8_9PEZI|nr:Glyoxalase/Bleomycin resistance protein/Dihydroxybiphenyl dioxygenase [Ascodesmis nigricans]
MSTSIQNFIWLPSSTISEAAAFYTSLFPSTDTKLSFITSPTDASEIFSASFRLLNQDFVLISNCPDDVTPTDAISFGIGCSSQEEIDRVWELFLKNGAEEKNCGWIKDKYGVAWQVYPVKLGEWMSNKEKMGSVMGAMMGMAGKLDLEALKKAHDE